MVELDRLAAARFHLCVQDTLRATVQVEVVPNAQVGGACAGSREERGQGAEGGKEPADGHRVADGPVKGLLVGDEWIRVRRTGAHDIGKVG
jgi:hypothetical protein